MIVYPVASRRRDERYGNEEDVGDEEKKDYGCPCAERRAPIVRFLERMQRLG